MPYRLLVLFSFCLAGVLTQSARAQFALPSDPINSPDSWDRGDTNTTYQEWNVFTSHLPSGVNSADAGLQNGNGTPNFRQTVAPAFSPIFGSTVLLTSTGNIYGPGVITNFELTIPQPILGSANGEKTDVILQVLTQGGGVDPTSVKIGTTSPSTSDEVLFATLPPNPNDPEQTPIQVFSNWYKWDELPGNAASYTITFNASELHTSLDRVAVDTHVVVPEPASLGLLACGSLLLLKRRR